MSPDERRCSNGGGSRAQCTRGRGGTRQRQIQQRGRQVQPLAGGGLREAQGGPALFVQRQGHRVAAKALLGDKALGGAGQFLQVLHPIGALALLAVMLDEAGVLEHQLDDLAQGQALRLLAQDVDLGDEST